jgi:peptidoglycan hydrolase-like protein with peptidoglycan-binding domain
MPDLAIDEAFSWADPQAVKNAGYTAVLGYLSDYPGKNWTLERVTACHACGLGVGFVWENGANDFLAGASFGAYAGRRANALVDQLGVPLSVPIFYAVDYDAQPGDLPALLAGLHAAENAGPRKAGGYGSIRLTEAAAADGLPDEWQAQAWSGTQVGPHASLYQRVSHTLSGIAGIDPAGYDEDVILSRAGLWFPGQITTASVTTPVVIAPPVKPGGYDVTGLPLLKLGSHGQPVRNLQGLLEAAARPTPIDGSFGPGTDRVLRQWQAAAGLTADGICGNRTWGVLLGARVG